MKEELIGFEVAKLAKQKGFNITNRNFYDENTGLMLPLDPYGHCYALEGTCPAPTQSLLQKWLRENYGLEIQHGSNNIDGYVVFVYYKNKDYKMDESDGPEFESEHYKTYEDALEIGLLEALKLI